MFPSGPETNVCVPSSLRAVHLGAAEWHRGLVSSLSKAAATTNEHFCADKCVLILSPQCGILELNMPFLSAYLNIGTVVAEM